jgi:hypothetical protein
VKIKKGFVFCLGKESQLYMKKRGLKPMALRTFFGRRLFESPPSTGLTLLGKAISSAK